MWYLSTFFHISVIYHNMLDEFASIISEMYVAILSIAIARSPLKSSNLRPISFGFGPTPTIWVPTGSWGRGHSKKCFGVLGYGLWRPYEPLEVQPWGQALLRLWTSWFEKKKTAAEGIQIDSEFLWREEARLNHNGEPELANLRVHINGWWNPLLRHCEIFR